MEDAADITKLVKDAMKSEGIQARNVRMDKDFDHWALKKEKQRGSYGFPTVDRDSFSTDIRIVSNAPRTFCDSVQSILTASERQIRVRMAEEGGEDKREDMGKLERLLEFAFEKADERLIRLLQPPLKDSLVWYSLVRGWTAGRFPVYKDKKDVIFDFLSYDPRWLVYLVGGKGLLWSGYTISMTPEELEDEYGKITKLRPWYKPWEKSRKSYDVIDFWKDEGERKKTNAIVCDEEIIHQETYDMLSMPVLIAPVATRPPIRGEMGVETEGYGESIFAPNREVDDVINKMVSVWASHAIRLAEQPIINYRTDQGVELENTVHYPGGMIDLPMGQNKLEPVPMEEISPTLVNLANLLDSWRVRGAFPDIDIGKPPPSGTLYNLVQETSNRVFNPQLRNLSAFYGDICRLTEEQLISGKIKVEGMIEQKHKYYKVEVRPVDLKKPHIIKVEFTARTPWTQLDTYQIADMAKRLGLPDAFIHEHILKLQDPKGIGDLSAIEMAEHSPKLAMLRAIQALMNAGRQDEAEQLIQDMYNMQQEEDAVAGQEQPPPITAREGGAPTGAV